MPSLRLVALDLLGGGTGRADPIAEVLLAQRAHLLLLIGAGDPDVIARLAWRLRMDSVVAPAGDSAVAALTPGAILSCENLGLLRHTPPTALLRVRVAGCMLAAVVTEADSATFPGVHVVAGRSDRPCPPGWHAAHHPLSGDIARIAAGDPPRKACTLAASMPISRAWLETDRLATYASDHYPIGIELELVTEQGSNV